MFTARYEIYENCTLQEVIRGLPQSYIKCPNLHGLLHPLLTAHIKTQLKFSTSSGPPPPPRSYSTKYSAFHRFNFLIFQRSVLSPTHLSQKEKRAMCGNIYGPTFSVSL
jgi:hypothetical protein